MTKHKKFFYIFLATILNLGSNAIAQDWTKCEYTSDSKLSKMSKSDIDKLYCQNNRIMFIGNRRSDALLKDYVFWNSNIQKETTVDGVYLSKRKAEESFRESVGHQKNAKACSNEISRVSNAIKSRSDNNKIPKCEKVVIKEVD